MNKIYRNIQRIDTQQDGRTISGYAVVFDSWSRDLGGFEEIIHKGAITQELLDNSDVIMNVNHNDSDMLARWRNGEGTLKLELREDGLYFEFEAPDTSLGNDILYHVKAGDYFECSFCFAIDDDETSQKWYLDGDDMKREIDRIAWLHDVSIVTTAAYPATSVSARSAEVEEMRTKLEQEKEAERKKQIVENLDAKRNEFLKNITI